MADFLKGLLRRAGLRVFGAMYVLYGSTLRYRYIDRLPQRQLLLGSFHQDLFVAIFMGWKFYRRGVRLAAIISDHSDGEYVVAGARASHCTVIRGSTASGGVKAYRQMLQAYSKGASPLFGLDGPLGPYHTIHAGAPVFAKHHNIPLYFMFFYVSHALTFKKAWDRFRLPCPFARVYTFISEPFYYNVNHDLAANVARLKNFGVSERIRFFKQIGKLGRICEFMSPQEVAQYKLMTGTSA